MKTPLYLAALGIILHLCHGYCTTALHSREMVNGQLVILDKCIDPLDGSEHAIGTQWNSSHCLECSCWRDTQHCCTRYGGIHANVGCQGVLDEDTCEYKFYKIDNPSQPCY